MFRIYLGLLFICFYSAIAIAANDGHEHPVAAELKARYLKLRNTDPDVKRSDNWRVVARELEAFAKSHANLTDAPALLFQSAIAFETLGRINLPDSEPDLNHASELLTLVANAYPNDALADDALIRRGDVYTDLNRETEAENTYREVIQRFPKGDMLTVARSRIKELKGDEEVGAKISGFKSEGSQLPINRLNLQKTIVIDPGHGGEDTGAKGAGGLLEKDVTFAVARELQNLLTQRTNAKVILTRRGDVFVPLADRTAIANENGADIFVSLHVNASAKGNLQGLETYYLDNTNDAASKKLADRENTERDEFNDDLDLILSDLIQSAKLGESISLGHTIQESLLTSFLKSSEELKNLGVKKAPFFVLVGAHMPCVLVEMLFIDNPAEGKKLAERDFRARLAAGLYDGIVKYLQSGPSASVGN